MARAPRSEKVTPTPSSHPGFMRADFSGPVYELIQRELLPHPEYQGLRAGRISLAEYGRILERSSERSFGTALTENQRNLVTRFPHSEEAFVDEALTSLQEGGIIPSVEYPKEAFAVFREHVRATFNHGGYMTFIFPEEERLVFALSHILRPKRALFLGSYYGYWGIWMLPALRSGSGHATFIDPNPETNAVARMNISALGFDECANVLDAEGTHFLNELLVRDSFDFLLLDAEGPDDAPDPQYRGKRVYLPLITTALRYLSPGATVLVHNILLRGNVSSPYFDRLIRKNGEELGAFMDFISRNFSNREIIDSTEGVGVFKL